jgi:NAD(P)-dependent dehydrogenase (short-subunit alcohol dehydrogenase family)
MPKTIVITGASSGFGASSARHLADAGHTVYAGIRGTTGKNAQAVADAVDYASQHHVQLRGCSTLKWPHRGTSIWPHPGRVGCGS